MVVKAMGFLDYIMRLLVGLILVIIALIVLAMAVCYIIIGVKTNTSKTLMTGLLIVILEVCIVGATINYYVNRD